jgi:hypothetical protein
MPRLLFPLAAAALLGFQAPEPPHTSHWTGDGDYLDRLREVSASPHGGPGFAPAKVGRGFAFDGVDDGLNLPDDPRLAFTRSLTLRAWVKCNGYPPPDQSWGMLVFRGDDRGGMDPYFLGIRHDGTLNFGVSSGPEDSSVQAPFPLGRFVQVTATLDDATGLQRLLYGERVVAETVTPIRPFRNLDPGAHAGIGIGNHARQGESVYNMPFRGIIDELTLSNRTTLVLESLTLGPMEPSGVVGQVRLAVPAPPGGASVRLSCPDGDLPGTVVVPACKQSVRFRAAGSPDAERLTITASYNGSSVSVSRTLPER